MRHFFVFVKEWEFNWNSTVPIKSGIESVGITIFVIRCGLLTGCTYIHMLYAMLRLFLLFNDFSLFFGLIGNFISISSTKGTKC